VSYDQKLCHTTKNCVIQPKIVSYNQNLCRTTKKLCHTTKNCVVRPKIVSYNQKLCRTTKNCVEQPKFVLCNQKLCRVSKNCVVSMTKICITQILSHQVKIFSKLPPNVMAGFDLSTHSSSLLGGRRKRYHYIGRSHRQGSPSKANFGCKLTETF
jgi:hypothetical protein